MKLLTRHVLFSFALIVAGFMLAAPAIAQQGVPQQPQQQPPPDVEVDDDELDTVAEAYVDVQMLTSEFNQVVQDAEDAEEAQAIQQEFAERANDVVSEHGITLERYDLVVRAATADDDLRQRLLTRIEGLMEDGGGN